MLRALLAWLLLSGMAMAQDIAIQAGEHPGFTRLALLIGADSGWRLGRIDDGYALLVDSGRGFDIGRVYETIPRDRIAGLRASEGRLDLAVACDCHADTFVHAGDWLVIDIADGSPDRNDPAEQWLAPPVGDTVSLPLQRVEQPFYLLPGAFSAFMAQDSGPGRMADPRAAEIGRDMVDAIARAADQGLLDLSPMPESVPAAPDTAAGPPPLPLAPPHAPGVPGLLAHSSGDIAPTVAPPDVTCPDPAAFDLAAWAGSGDFATEIAAGWAALTDGRDRITSDAAVDLARRYVAFGFGREALQVLALDPQADATRDQLGVLARIVDGRAVSPAVFTRAAQCPGPLSLWQALGMETVTDLSEEGRTAATIALRALPAPLRDQLAPRLAAAFAAGGDPLAAEDLLGTVSQPAPRDVVEVALAADDQSAALGALEDMARDDPRLTPDDLAQLVTLAIDAGRPLDPRTLDLLRAAQFEYRDQPEEIVLSTAEIRLLTAQGELAPALQRIAGLPESARAEALASVLSALAAAPDSAAFAEVYFSNAAPLDLAGVAAPAVNDLARRLISEGFPDVALTLLTPAVNGADMAERRYLRATAAAALGRQDLVDAALIGLSDDRAAAIRAGSDGATAPLWRAGDWDALASSEDPLLAEVGTARLAEPPAVTDVAALESRQSLLEDAATTRTLARSLLDRFPMPERR